VLPGAEAYDTANVIMRFANGKEAKIDVCRQAPYGYDQRAEVLGSKAMIVTDNAYPNTARIYSASFTGNADLPFDFFMSRYKEAYIQETLAFVDSLVNDKPVPCSGEDGLIALLMAIAAEISAEERRWVKFDGPQMQQLLSGMSNELPFVKESTGGTVSFGKFTKALSGKGEGGFWSRVFGR